MKKFTAILLALLMLVSCGAVTAFAENGPSEQQWLPEEYLAYISIINNSVDGGYYSVFRNNSANNEALDGASYDRATNTLTLTNLNMPGYALGTNMMGDDFKIKVVGDCALRCISVWGDGYGGSLSIIGDGTLTVNEDKTADNAIILNPEGADVKLTFGDEVKLNLYAPENVILVRAANGQDASNCFEFNDGKEYSVKVVQSYTDEFKHINGYYMRGLVEDDHDYLGLLTTKADDPDGIYATSVYLNDNLEPNGEYGIKKYLYSEKFNYYFEDPSFKNVVLSAEEMKEQGYEIMYEEKAREYPEYVENPVIAERIRCKVYTDEADNIYYIWDSGNVIEEIKDIALDGEAIEGYEGEYIFNNNADNDEIDIEDLTYTGSTANGYYITNYEPEEAQWLGEKLMSENDPDGVYAAHEWYRTDGDDNITESGVTVYKYIFNEDLGFYMNDTSFSDNENFNLYGSREMTADEFENSEFTVVYPVEQVGEYLSNPDYRRGSWGSYFAAYADSEGREYVVESDYSEETETKVVLDMDEIDVLDNWFWLTPNSDVSADSLTPVKLVEPIEGRYDYLVEGDELIYSPVPAQTTTTEATEQTQPTEPTAATQVTEPTQPTEVTQPTSGTQATEATTPSKEPQTTETKAPTGPSTETQPSTSEVIKPAETEATQPAATEEAKPAESDTKNIKNCKISGITAKTYNGKAQTQSVVVKDGSKKLVKNTDYTVSYKDNRNAGKATVTITGKGKYKGSVSKTFTIKKAANSLTVKAASKSIKASAVNKKAQSFTPAVINKKGQGTVSYKLGSNNSKVKKYFTVNKAGKITAKKNTPKGTYKVKISVTAAGNGNYKKATKDATVTVKIK